MEKIDRNSPLPLYYQLKQILIAEIDQKGLLPGDRLLGDNLLCEKYGVSRTVVRQALADLKAADIVDRVKGRGTFVARRKAPVHLVQSMIGIFEDVSARGSQLRSDVRRLEIAPADKALADSLEIEIGDPVIVIERLRYVDDEPWVLTLTQIPYAIAPGLLNEDLSEQSIYSLLEDKYGVALKRGRRSLEGSVAGRSLARDLNIKTGSPIIILKGTSFDIDGRPVEDYVVYHRSDRIRFEFEVERTTTRGMLSPVSATA
jgi:GntR family transcriptional regulator